MLWVSLSVVDSSSSIKDSFQAWSPEPFLGEKHGIFLWKFGTFLDPTASPHLHLPASSPPIPERTTWRQTLAIDCIGKKKSVYR